MIRNVRKFIGCSSLVWLLAACGGETETDPLALGTPGLPFETASLFLRSSATSGDLEDGSFSATVDPEDSGLFWVIFQIGGNYPLSGEIHVGITDCKPSESPWGDEECAFTVEAPLEVVARANWSDPYADGATVTFDGGWTGVAYPSDDSVYVEGPEQATLLEFRTAQSQTVTKYRAEGFSATLEDDEFSLDATLTRD